MKKILVITLGAVVFFGCSKKNDSSASSSIVGKWYVTTDSVAQYTNGTLSDHSTTTLNHTAYAVFNSDGSGVSVAPDGNAIDTIKYTYTVSGKTLTIKYPTQTIDGETVQGYSEPMTVSVLTGSKLETQDTFSEVEGGITYKIYEQTDFTK